MSVNFITALIKSLILITVCNLHPAPACENLTALYVPENIDVLLKDGVMHGSVVKIKCPQNYQLIGSQTVECYEGTWKQYLPTCERE